LSAVHDATEKWWYERPTGEQLEIWAYTSQVSYRAGEAVAFHVHTTARDFSVVMMAMARRCP
jgi:hypothetical protein